MLLLRLRRLLPPLAVNTRAVFQLPPPKQAGGFWFAEDQRSHRLRRTFSSSSYQGVDDDDDRSHSTDSDDAVGEDHGGGEVPGLDNDEHRVDTELHHELLRHYHLKASAKQHLFVIQPFLRKFGTGRSGDPLAPQLMMDESIALADTLGWEVVDKVTMGVNSFLKREFFGEGQLDILREKIQSTVGISSVFLSTYQLRSHQRLLLEDHFGLPVLDRYNVILQIFQRHARTKEARLQVALAEIPYLKARLYGDVAVENTMKHSKQRKGDLFFETREMALKRREGKLKLQLAEIKSNREKLRQLRRTLHIPSVAVVGYTNCGKTSLIKALTGDDLEPKDQLFATLDVTVHEGALPSKLKALFVDTVGFISDIPTSLIASFSATLEDASMADLIIHVRDISHPDTEAQSQNVLDTLRRLDIPRSLVASMITVGNKVDKLEGEKEALSGLKEADFVPISTTHGYGLDVVRRLVEQKLMVLTGRKRMTFRCKTGSQEYLWLQRHVTVSEVVPDKEDLNYSLLSTVILPMDVERFKKDFRLNK